MDIKKLREALFMTQFELAEQLNVSKTSVCLWETSGRQIALRHKRKLKELCEKNNLKFEDYCK